MRVSLPLEKKLRILDFCKNLCSKEECVIRELAVFVGILISSLPAVQYGSLFYKYLEMDKVAALRKSCGNFDAMMTLSPEALSEIYWWDQNVLNCSKSLNLTPHSVVLQSDASLTGWGGVYNNICTGGHWSEEERKLHINVLELKAVLFALRSLMNVFSHVHIQIQTDNTTAVSYINNFGGVKSAQCHKVTKEIWLWAMSRQNYLSAAYLPGTQNVYADRASRCISENTEWQLNTNVFQQLCSRFGLFDIDLFASRLNAHCPRFCSWKPDPHADFIDAFSCSWNNFANPYAFPPFSVIAQCLRKISVEKSQVVLVAPVWPTQPWFPKMMRMIITVPLVLPLGVLKLPFQKNKVHKQYKTLRLMVSRLSGNSMLSEEFLRNLPTSSAPLGEFPHNLSTKSMLRNGFISVIEGKWIPCNLMT